jgi:deoxyribodipyrimidine photo-lyase
MHPPPVENPVSAKERFEELFNCPIPPAPENKRLSTEEAETLHLTFPAGSEKAHSRLSCFLTERAKAYAINRDFPSRPGTSVLSPYFAAGVLSARTAVSLARKANNDSLIPGHQGLATWISEVAWRDFYKHVLVAFPYIW